MSRQTIGSSPSRGPGPWLGLLLALAPACQEERATPDAQAPEIQQLLNDPWVYTDWTSWGEEDGLPPPGLRGEGPRLVGQAVGKLEVAERKIAIRIRRAMNMLVFVGL